MLSTLKLLESKGRFLEPCATSLSLLSFACDWQSNKAKFRSPSCSSSNDSSSNGSCWIEQENLLFHQSRSPRKNFDHLFFVRLGNMISMVFQLFMRFGHMLFEEDAHLESNVLYLWSVFQHGSFPYRSLLLHICFLDFWFGFTTETRE